MLSMLLFNGKHLDYFHDLCQVMPEKLHIFIIVHPPFIKKDGPKSVMVTASLGGSTEHHLAHSQFFSLTMCHCWRNRRTWVGTVKALFALIANFYFILFFFHIAVERCNTVILLQYKSLKKEVTVDGLQIIQIFKVFCFQGLWDLIGRVSPYFLKPTISSILLAVCQ